MDMVIGPLFCVGFSYGVYQSFKALHGTPQSERVLPQTETDLKGLDAGDGLDDTEMLDYWSRTDIADQIDFGSPEEHADLSAQDGLLPAAEDRVYYIGIHQDRVAVFEGLPAEGRLFRLTNRPVAFHLAKSRSENGWGCGKREMLEALEGYMQ